MHKGYQKIEKAKLKLMLRDRKLSELLNHFPITIKKGIETAATNGRDIFFGEAFLDGITLNDTVFILLHELMHIILSHVTRIGERDHKGFNIACDIVINDLLEQSEYYFDTIKPVVGRMFGLYTKDTSAEIVYDQLEGTDSDVVVTNHHLWDSLSDDEKNEIKEWVKTHLGDESKMGDSEIMKRLIKFQQDTPNHSTLEQFLRPYMVVAREDYHYQRTDQRYEEVLMPYFSSNELSINDLWIVIDVSGSMTETLLNQIFNQLNHLWKLYPSTAFYISFFSLHLTHPKKVTTSRELRTMLNHIDSSGGTNMHVIFENYHTLFKQKPIANIIITDGYGDSPHMHMKPSTPTAWVLTEDSDFKPKFGDVILWEVEDAL